MQRHNNLLTDLSILLFSSSLSFPSNWYFSAAVFYATPLKTFTKFVVHLPHKMTVQDHFKRYFARVFLPSPGFEPTTFWLLPGHLSYSDLHVSNQTFTLALLAASTLEDLAEVTKTTTCSHQGHNQEPVSPIKWLGSSFTYSSEQLGPPCNT